jgi:hypothetical protein
MRGDVRDITVAERVEIAELLAGYGRIIDAQDWAALATVFTADAHFDITPLGARGVLDGLPAIQHHMAHAARHPAAHHITNVHVEALRDDCALVASKLIAVQHDGSSASGRYEDEVVRTPDGLRIRRRAFSWVLPPG